MSPDTFPVATPFLILIAIIVVGALAAAIWFARVSNARRNDLQRLQNENNALQKRERLVLATALASELTENRIKCEAFITIYTDLLRNLRETEQRAAYEDTGDFVHQHPPLNRTAYDRNIENLSMLGPKIADGLTNVYAAFRSDPQYFSMEKTMPRTTAIRTVEMILDDTQKTLTPIDALISALNVIIRDGNNRR